VALIVRFIMASGVVTVVGACSQADPLVTLAAKTTGMPPVDTETWALCVCP
jgi:hypothetical protein